MPPWFERDQPTPFDRLSIEGKRNLDGDQLAVKYRQAWVQGRQYPIIRFPSGAEHEITTGRGDPREAHVHLFGDIELPYRHTRDEAYDLISTTVRSQGYIIGRERDNRLRIDNPQTGRSYVISFDNAARHISNLEALPDYAMELMPGEVRAVLPPLYSQEAQGLAAIAPVRYFTPDSSWTWYPTEFDGEDVFFGLVSGFEVELGYFTLSELESVRGGLGLPIERDLYYSPQTLRELQTHEQQLKR